MIPKIIHHIWTSNNSFKVKFHAFRSSWMANNPNYSFMFWTLENAPYDAMTPECKKILHSDCMYVIKSNVLRWVILHKYGGIISDCDVQCLKSFDEFLNDRSFCARSWLDNEYGNALVGSEPGNQMCLDICHQTSESVLGNWQEANSEWEYKYGVLIAAQHLHKCEKIYPKEFFYPFNWNDLEADRKLLINKKFEQSYAIHWWSSFDHDGWLKEARRKVNAPSIS